MGELEHQPAQHRPKQCHTDMEWKRLLCPLGQQGGKGKRHLGQHSVHTPSPATGHCRVQCHFLSGVPIDLCLETESPLRLPHVVLALGTYALLHPGHWTEQPGLLLLCQAPAACSPASLAPASPFRARGFRWFSRTGTVRSILVYRIRMTVQLNSRSCARWVIKCAVYVLGYQTFCTPDC